MLFVVVVAVVVVLVLKKCNLLPLGLFMYLRSLKIELKLFSRCLAGS